MADSRWVGKTITVLGVGALVGFGTCTIGASIAGSRVSVVSAWVGAILLLVSIIGMIGVALIALALSIAERHRR